MRDRFERFDPPPNAFRVASSVARFAWRTPRRPRTRPDRVQTRDFLPLLQSFIANAVPSPAPLLPSQAAVVGVSTVLLASPAFAATIKLGGDNGELGFFVSTHLPPVSRSGFQFGNPCHVILRVTNPNEPIGKPTTASG